MEEPLTKKKKLFDLENNSPVKLKMEVDSLKESKSEDDPLVNSKTETISLTKKAEHQLNTESPDDKSLFPFPEDDDASGMLEGVDLTKQWPSVTERYFTPFYNIDVQSPGDDICIRMHSNRICMVSLAPSHSIFQRKKQVSKVNFRVSEKLDRAQNKVSGKGKHGAQPLQANSNICSITCTDKEMYMIKCCLIGKLVEVNELLVTNPSLLNEPPHKGGYLAIVLPNIKLLDDIKKKFLTQEDYEAALDERKAKLKLAELKERADYEIEVKG